MDVVMPPRMMGLFGWMIWTFHGWWTPLNECFDASMDDRPFGWFLGCFHGW
jgi:hypothetical protein